MWKGDKSALSKVHCLAGEQKGGEKCAGFTE